MCDLTKSFCVFLILFYCVLCNNNGLPCNKDFAVDITDGIEYKNGSILHNGILYFPTTAFKIDSRIFGCVCQIRSCVTKCCERGLIIDEKGQCVKPYNPVMFDVPFNNARAGIETYNIIKVPCKNYFVLDPTLEDDQFVITQDGMLVLHKAVPKHEYSLGEYCLDNFVSKSFMVSARVCVDVDQATGSSLFSISFGMLISIPFLFLTFVVCLLLPERNLHRKCLMSYVLALMLAYIFLVTLQQGQIENDGLCKSLATLTWYFFFASFAWVFNISFDIWRNFRGMRSTRTHQARKFYIYCGTAWGVTAIIVLTLYLINVHGINESSKYHFGFGVGQCWFRGDLPNFLYFYLPVGLLMLCNIFFFVSTAIKIKNVKRETAMLKRSDSCKHTNEDRQSFQIYLKLLLAMGLNWIAELISAIVGWQHPELKNHWAWYIFDLFNALYGVFIFFLFVMKDKTWKLIKKRFNAHFSPSSYQPTSQSDRTGSISLNTMDTTVKLNTTA